MTEDLTPPSRPDPEAAAAAASPPIPDDPESVVSAAPEPLIPGELLPAAGEIELRPGTPRITVRVVSTADRPVQVGSHFHFFEANRALRFDRVAAYGMRLAIPAGTAVRFEPGETRDVELLTIGGRRIVHGFSGLVEGPLDEPGALGRAIDRMRAAGFLDSAARLSEETP